MATKKIVVLSTSQVASGEKNGRSWTLYEVTALTEHGEPIETTLKSFEHFPAGPVEVEVEEQNHDKYGKSFMLKTKGGGGGGRASSGSAPSGEVAALRARIEAIERRLGMVDGQPVAATVATPAPAPAPQPTTGFGPQPAGRFTDDDDIPF